MTHRSADILPRDRIEFKIKSNDYRLIVAVKYAPFYSVFHSLIGTHADYDRTTVRH